METTDEHCPAEATENTRRSPVLFNDVYVNRWEAVAPAPFPCPAAWTPFPFPRLPSELRLDIWRLHLQRHRMIEIDIGAGVGPGDSESHSYATHNHLGRIVSAGRYYLAIRDDESPPVSALFQVNREARGAALRFYHIHLPFKRGGPILYLNSEYDVVFARRKYSAVIWDPSIPSIRPDFAKLLVDFLHDARAYDCKDQGYAFFFLGPCYPRSGSSLIER